VPKRLKNNRKDTYIMTAAPPQPMDAMSCNKIKIHYHFIFQQSRLGLLGTLKHQERAGCCRSTFRH